MTEKELDDIFCQRLKSCISGCKLPEEFTGKLKASVRRSRRSMRLCIVLTTTFAVILSVALTGLMHSPSQDDDTKCALVAKCDNKTPEKVSCWMLLGFFRDCFKRNRNGRRKK